uniref:Dihydrofolate synthase/folylpolyglutamate synthase n=1 Tax=Candidatus Kentrum sp. TUN TaxID=2126343 RepID=A0A451A078_9GAMM|nr:MAG: dihydrofolate synthase / folylpolyglutamate synthase [Candidatus Kentron sp. TUN]VFK58938.1 MAG: dihydrofolate synthase / folylpolyglutamate synthase [Candidatus Kentron sp. TUN]VFK59427.1 MAG: dihydrofolate synthase / folylpolyglutamate synthase [Candidatus Kentron sp. TUN]
MRFNHLSDWLAWQETLHHKSVDFGLERIGRVAMRLGIDSTPFPIVSVAGTNGKGSCVALLESIFRQGGYRVGAYTSPHLLRYNERVRIMGHEVPDGELIRAFDEIDRARGETTLTYFEFGTLAAMVLFCRAELDVVVLEVGVGGRLDAVNLFDADLALVTTVGIDHVAWLGHDRETIAREKAGIFRPGRPAVCGDPHPPISLVDHADSIGAFLHCAGKDFRFFMEADGWRWEGGADSSYGSLPKPALAGRHQVQNAAAVLMAVELMRHLLVSEDALRRGLCEVALPGRFQVFLGEDGITRILDVAHNQEAARTLARVLQGHPCDGRTLAVFAILEDKCIEAVLRAMWLVVDAWYVSDLDVPRGGTANEIVGVMSRIGVDVDVVSETTILEAYNTALRSAGSGDRIVVFGSFYTVGEVLESLGSSAGCLEIPGGDFAYPLPSE